MTESCSRHPGREASYYCQKDGTYLCEECACCHNAVIYCRYRTACIIDMLIKEGELKPCEAKSRHPAGPGDDKTEVNAYMK